MDSDSVRGIDRRRLLGWGGLAAAAGIVTAGSVVGAQFGNAAPAPTDSDLPPGTLPGGAYDQYIAQLAAQGTFSGVVLLSHQGQTVLSRSYGMADKEREIPNSEHIAFNLSSAGKPFGGVAIMQLVQQGKVNLADPVGTHLTGYTTDIAQQVTIHHLLTTTAGLSDADVDPQRIFYSTDEVHEFYEQWTRQATLMAPPGSASQAHTAGGGAGLAMAAQIVEAVTGQTYWDYVQEHIFGRCGMTGSGFYTRPQWLTDPHIAHPYMTLADGSRVDAIRNLNDSSPSADALGINPGRAFIDAPGNGGFTTAVDLVRFAQGLGDGTLLERPYADVLFGAKIPHAGSPTSPSFDAYTLPVHIIQGQWLFERGGANPGIGANWDIYPHSGWVGVILGNYDNLPLQQMVQQEIQAVTGQPVSGGGGG